MSEISFSLPRAPAPSSFADDDGGGRACLFSLPPPPPPFTSSSLGDHAPSTSSRPCSCFPRPASARSCFHLLFALASSILLGLGSIAHFPSSSLQHIFLFLALKLGHEGGEDRAVQLLLHLLSMYAGNQLNSHLALVPSLLCGGRSDTPQLSLQGDERGRGRGRGAEVEGKKVGAGKARRKRGIISSFFLILTLFTHS
eukprot:766489-Hanusia_phi.AAC.2